MPKVLVLDHSAYGPIEATAQAAVDLVQPPPHHGAFARRTAHMLDMMNIALQVLRRALITIHHVPETTPLGSQQEVARSYKYRRWTERRR